MRLATPIFDLVQPKNFDQLLIFVNLYQHAKNQLIHFVPSSDTINFRAVTKTATSIFDHAHPENFQLSFNLRESVPACKNSVVSICLFLRYSKFQSPETRLATPIFDYALPKIIGQILTFLTLYQHKKAETVLSIFSGEIIDLKFCNMIG